MTAKSLNYFEESNIKNRQLPEEWQSQDALDELSEFLQQNWEQRSVFFDDGIVTSRQQYLSFIGQKGIRTNNYVGTIAFKGKQLNIFPKILLYKLSSILFLKFCPKIISFFPLYMCLISFV